MTHARVWKFRPREGHEREFADAYGPHGAWAGLFGKARTYRGTELLRPEEMGGWWLTIDRWDTAADFDAFQRDFWDDYRKLDAELAELSGEEEFVGAFEEAG